MTTPRERTAVDGTDPIGQLTTLPGVGPARAKSLEKLGVFSLRDLLFLRPAGVHVWEPNVTSSLARERVGETARVRGKVDSMRLTRFGGKRSMVRVTLRDEAGKIDAVWFNRPWIRDQLEQGEVVELCGAVVETKAGPALSSPRIGRAKDPLPEPGMVEPLYPGVDGMSGESVAKLCHAVAREHAAGLIDPLPAAALAELDLPSLATAALHAHLPRSAGAFEAARRRLAFEPLLAVQARLHERRTSEREGRARRAEVGDALHTEICGRFPFELTPDQNTVVSELRHDLARAVPMRRLLQGEVGAGKTVLALYAAIAVVENDGQVAIMAPTELLAEQHYYGSREVLADAGVEAGLITGSMPKDERRYLLERLADGRVQVLFGTHALFSQDVRFARLDLAIIDEQHRFGVGQRAALAEKGDEVHLLLMTATPIPRTLALTVYGDLEVSTMKNLPPGRGEVTTEWLRGERVRAVSKFLAERLEAGEQVYWVCPRIGGEKGVARTAAAERRYEQALESKLATYGVELVHGRLPAEERAYRLDRFRRGEIGLLVATTVIEVGVDVSSASVMVIENAERLGLAQLHQLRGRVGRGAADSFCFLIGDKKAAPRFELLERSRDGFELAEADLRQRGMGDLAGVRQSGANFEGMDDLERDVDLVIAARDLMRTRPELRAAYAGRADGAPTP